MLIFLFTEDFSSKSLETGFVIFFEWPLTYQENSLDVETSSFYYIKYSSVYVYKF